MLSLVTAPLFIDVAPSCGPCSGLGTEPGGLFLLIAAALCVLARRER